MRAPLLMIVPALAALAGCQSLRPVLEVDLHGEWQVQAIDRAPLHRSNNAYVAFTEDGRILGSTGCNLLAGSYRLQRGKLTLSPLGTTRRACAETPLAAEEQQLLQALASVRGVRRKGEQLLLTDAEDEVRISTRPRPADAGPQGRE
jgi:putative lipoprotein